MDGVICGDCLEEMPKIDDNSIDAIVTDPPAAINFMQKSWDSDKGGRTQWIAWMSRVAAECLRVIKPGGHALVWALPRTSHWTGMAWEEAGWEPRDKIAHVFGSGFPKSLDISKKLDRMAGAEREVISGTGKSSEYAGKFDQKSSSDRLKFGEPITDAAKQWSGFGTSLKPAHEDWWLFRKPLTCKTIAENVLEWGCGGLNIDASRIATDEIAKVVDVQRPHASKGVYGDYLGECKERNGNGASSALGRFPANLIWSHSPLCTDAACHPSCPSWEFAKAGERKSGSGDKHNKSKCGKDTIYQSGIKPISGLREYESSTGSAARFFQSCQFTEEDISAFIYQAKASRAEREKGLDGMPEHKAEFGTGGNKRLNDPAAKVARGRNPVETLPIKNNHPTVKPLALMRYLCRLITPPNGLILDPFTGSGTTLLAAKQEGFRFIGIEKEAEYCDICRKRIAAVPASLSNWCETLK